MAEVEWIKLYLKTFRTSRKISAIEQMKNGDTIIIIWFKLLCLAGEINNGGMIYITEKIPFDPVSLANELRKPRAVVDKAIKVFEEHDMIFKDDAGFIQIVNWEKYQSVDRMAEIREQNRERKRAQRSREKQEKKCDPSRDSSVTVTQEVTQSHAIEEEGEEDKDIHSFILSRAKEDEINVTDKERVKRELMGGTLGGGVVMLSDAEVDKLLDELSLDEFDYYVGVVRDCERKGQKFKRKTHFQAIMEMAMADRMKAVSPQKKSNPKKQDGQQAGSFDTNDFYAAAVRKTFGDDE